MQQTQQYDLNMDSVTYPSGNVVRYRNHTAKEPDVATVAAGIKPNTDPLYLIPKRLFDIVVSGAALLLLSPVMLLTALAIKIEDPKGAVFYNAPRGG